MTDNLERLDAVRHVALNRAIELHRNYDVATEQVVKTAEAFLVFLNGGSK